MQRPRRQAAVDAMAKIKQVHEWETLSESSKRFREAAAQIEAEFHTEEKHQHVHTVDLDVDPTCISDEEQEEENSSDMKSFIEDDLESSDIDNPDNELCSAELEAEEASEQEVLEGTGNAHEAQDGENQEEL